MNDTEKQSPNEDANVATYKDAWRRSALLFLALVALSALALWWIDALNLRRWRKAVPAFLDLADRMLPPDFSDWHSWLQPLYNTLAMSVAGTAVAVAAAVPLGILAAKNSSPHPGIYYAARIALNFMRGVPDLIFAIVVVGALGPGPLAGAMALGFHSAGVLGKFFAEIIEHTDAAAIEAVRSTGAGRLQTLYHGYIALAVPQLADAAVYRFECNFRNSMMLGMVGAGGIGFEIYSAFTILKYREVMALLIVVLSLVTVVDTLGARLRQRLK
jgi:phosphonate transport system permease protein